MRYPPEHKERVREQIVRAAARGFRARGGDGVAIADLMRELRLTHGGFYRHFQGKEELFEEALRAAMDETQERLSRAAAGAPPGGAIRAIVETYLGEAHCAHPGQGCPIAALAGEIARHDAATRRTLDRQVERAAAAMAPYLPGKTPAQRRSAGLLLFAGMAGVLNVARALSDESLRRALLDAARRHFTEAFSQPA